MFLHLPHAIVVTLEFRKVDAVTLMLDLAASGGFYAAARPCQECFPIDSTVGIDTV